MKKNIILLLTGAINSSDIIDMKRSATNERLNDYVSAISKWASSDIDKIVFVENTNYPKEKLLDRIKNPEKLEYLTYDGQHFPRSLGKGYGEINAMDFAFNNSKFLKDADFVIKCNGRYYVKKYKILLKYLQNTKADVVGNFLEHLKFLDTKIVVFTPAFFFNYLLKYKPYINDSENIYMEHAFSFATHELLKDRGYWKPLPFPLVIDGFSGTENYRYNTWRNNLKTTLRYKLLNLANGLIN